MATGFSHWGPRKHHGLCFSSPPPPPSCLQISGYRGIGAVTGLAATALFPWLSRQMGLARAGMLGIGFQVGLHGLGACWPVHVAVIQAHEPKPCCGNVVPCVREGLPRIRGGAPLQSNWTWPSTGKKQRSLPRLCTQSTCGTPRRTLTRPDPSPIVNVMQLTCLVLGVGPLFISQAAHPAREASRPPAGIVRGVVAGVVSSRLGLWTFDLAVTQLVQELTPADELGGGEGGDCHCFAPWLGPAYSCALQPHCLPWLHL